MRSALVTFALILHAAAWAGNFTLRVEAPGYAGKAALLYRYDDLFTLRPVRIAEAAIGDDGQAVLTADVEGTAKLQLRIGDVVGDLFARPGNPLHLRFPLPDARTAKSLSGTTRVFPELLDLSPLDINALTTDLNDRVDAFINEDLATDQIAGMQAVEIMRNDSAQLPTDSVHRPATLFVTPSWSEARVDTFERKLRRFYAEVQDPWFAHYLTFSMAGLRQGPRVNDRDLHQQYLANATVHYDDPEYVRFIRSFHSEQLAHVQRFQATAMKEAMATAQVDSLKALFARNEFLRDDDRLTELVLMDQLYTHFNSKQLDRGQVAAVLQKIAASSAYPEHRHIATNMLWDLLTMRAGQPLPAVRVTDPAGKAVLLDSLLDGAVCLAITASWCTYCELEMAGLEKLHKEYPGTIRIIAINLDSTLQSMNAYRRAHPGQDFTWLHSEAEQQLREDLRLRTLPAFFLLNGATLARSPAPLPSNGLGELFHQAKVELDRANKVRVWDE